MNHLSFNQKFVAAALYKLKQGLLGKLLAFAETQGKSKYLKKHDFYITIFDHNSELFKSLSYQ